MHREVDGRVTSTSVLYYDVLDDFFVLQEPPLPYDPLPTLGGSARTTVMNDILEVVDGCCRVDRHFERDALRG